MVFFGDVCKSRFQKTTHGQSCDSNRPCFGAKTKKKSFLNRPPKSWMSAGASKRAANRGTTENLYSYTHWYSWGMVVVK